MVVGILRDAISKFLDQLQMPNFDDPPRTMNITVKHVLRHEITFRKKDIKQFSAPKRTIQQ